MDFEIAFDELDLSSEEDDCTGTCVDLEDLEVITPASSNKSTKSVMVKGSPNLQYGMEKFNEHLDYATDKLKIQYDLNSKQLEALRSLYSGRDVMVVIATGGGKSTVFQLLPWLIQKRDNLDGPATVITVCPLNSIMTDQVSCLNQKGFDACYLTLNGNAFTHDETEIPLTDIEEGKFQFVFMHPETLIDAKKISQLIRKPNFKRIVAGLCIDECHLVAEWGTDEFRKSFQRLGEAVHILADRPHVALTATATVEKMKELATMMNFENTDYVTDNPDRPNIYLEKRLSDANNDKETKLENILIPFILELKEHRTDTPVTVIYVDMIESCGRAFKLTESYLPEELQYEPRSSRKTEDRLFAQFHKNSTPAMKKIIIHQLTQEHPKLCLVYATVALGIGLDSPSIVRVIHMRPPTSLEAYSQEIGRSGRRGQQATAIMYYNKSSIASNRRHLQPTMRNYANCTTCLRKFTASYYNYSQVLYKGPAALCCSNCKASCT